MGGLNVVSAGSHKGRGKLGMNLKSAQVIRQIQLVRRYGLAGQSLFDLDETLEKSVLPELRRTGTW